MKLVVDTSIIISVLVAELEKPKIIEKTIGCELVAPRSVHYEIGNAFSSLFKRNLIDLEKSQKAISLYEKIEIDFLEIDLFNSIELCDKFNIYAYVISCALQNQFPLFSLDKKLIEVSKKLGLTILEV